MMLNYAKLKQRTTNRQIAKMKNMRIVVTQKHWLEMTASDRSIYRQI